MSSSIDFLAVYDFRNDKKYIFTSSISCPLCVHIGIGTLGDGKEPSFDISLSFSDAEKLAEHLLYLVKKPYAPEVG